MAVTSIVVGVVWRRMLTSNLHSRNESDREHGGRGFVERDEEEPVLCEDRGALG